MKKAPPVKHRSSGSSSGSKQWWSASWLEWAAGMLENVGAWIIALGGVFYYYLALLTYHAGDPSYYSARAPDPLTVSNSGGVFGAELSAHLLTWLGVSAYILPLWLWLLAPGLRSPALNAAEKRRGDPRGKRAKNQFRIIRWAGHVFRYSSFAARALGGVGCLCFFFYLTQFSHSRGGWLGGYVGKWGEYYLGLGGSWGILVSVALCLLTVELSRRGWLGPMLRCFGSMMAIITTERGVGTLGGLLSRWRHRVTGEVFSHQNSWLAQLWSWFSALVFWLRRQGSDAVERTGGLLQDSESLSEVASSQGPSANSGVSLALSNDDHRGDGPENLADIPLEPPSSYLSPSRSMTSASSPDKTSINQPDQPVELIYADQNYRRFFKRQKGLLQAPSSAEQRGREKRGRAAGAVLATTLRDFQITGEMLGFETGPRVRTFEFEPAPGMKQTKLIALSDDIARALKVESVIIQPIPGRSSMGIQVPRQDSAMVYLGDVLGHESVAQILPLAMGVSPGGDPVIMDLAKMPHLLMAGATGSGKSVGIHSLINSLICTRSPDDVRLILVDPKMLELSVYSGLPHLAAPVITDVQQACSMLEWAVGEMESRYRLMQDMQVRNIAQLHKRQKQLSRGQLDKDRELYPSGEIEDIPYLVIVIDELADLMLMAPKDVEGYIQRLSQKARASGIHLVLATQRPSVDVITGVIKANFPARMAYQVVSKHDSRTILDQVGAEKLLGKGDLLFQSPARLKPERLQGAYVGEDEIRSLMTQLCSDFSRNSLSSLQEKMVQQKKSDDLSSAQCDPRWEEALEVARSKGSISASFLQRRLSIGYNRAARIIEAMEAGGYISTASGVKPRKWLGGPEAVDGCGD